MPGQTPRVVNHLYHTHHTHHTPHAPHTHHPHTTTHHTHTPHTTNTQQTHTTNTHNKHTHTHNKHTTTTQQTQHTTTQQHNNTTPQHHNTTTHNTQHTTQTTHTTPLHSTPPHPTTHTPPTHHHTPHTHTTHTPHTHHTHTTHTTLAFGSGLTLCWPVFLTLAVSQSWLNALCGPRLVAANVGSGACGATNSSLHIDGQPSQCMPSDRFLGNVRQKALVWVLVLVRVLVVGLVWLGVPRASLQPSGDSLLLGDATWASPVRTAITWLDACMWYREVGSLGAKG